MPFFFNFNDMKYLILISLVLLGCGENEVGGGCPSPTKDIFSPWTSLISGNTHRMQNCELHTDCHIKFGPGVCNDLRGDYTIWISDSFMIFTDCANITLLDTADWEISCQNILKITYDSNGSTARFD